MKFQVELGNMALAAVPHACPFLFHMCTSVCNHLQASPPLDTSHVSSSNTPSTTTLLTATLVPILCTLAVVAGATILLVQRACRRQARKGLGPPRSGPDVTLLVTDIESSTTMWESLPAAVMDNALKLHHECIRKHLLKWGGELGGVRRRSGDGSIV